MISEVVAAVSVLIAVTAVLFSLWQNVLQRRALQARVFLNIIEQSRTTDLANGINTTLALKPYDTFETFEKTESEAAQEDIFRLVDTLNNVASLVELKLITRQNVWDVYFWAFRKTFQKLVPWWLDGIRAQSYDQRFSAFERMGRQVMQITDEEIIRFDNKRKRRK